MNKNLMIILVLLFVLVIGAVLYFVTAGDDGSYVATSTPVVVGNNTNTNTQKATEPTAITSTTVFASDNTATVVGTVNPKGSFSSYWYEYGVTSNLGSKTSNQTIGSGFTSIQAPGYITNLTKNTTYYFRLVAENQYGKVFGNQYTFKTTEGTPAPVGSIPTAKTISASGVSRTGATINGEVTPNKASTQYWFEYGKTVELGSTSALSSVGNGSVKVSASISLSDLDPLTTYYFRLNAQNQFGTTNGSILNFKTLGPATVTAKAPSVTTGSADGLTSSEATLHGTVIPNRADTKYWFEYSTDSLFGQILLTTTAKVSVGAGETAVPVDEIITELTPKTNYYFRIVAENSIGTVRGERVTFKTK